jgi:predicted AAA+ superfamily ATPase
MSLKPWREIIVPHVDVLNGTFQQSEFAADLTAVRSGKATPEYGDAKAFYERTFITEGMSKLLIEVALRLNGKGGEPVIQLQTAFGGGKTHTMLAVYHLASRQCGLKDLTGIPTLLDKAGLLDVPQAQVAVLDGIAHSPGQMWMRGKQSIRTLWGELAWQLGKSDGYALVQESDASGTSPGKDVLVTLLARFAPCVVLVDEIVAYIRQFPDGIVLSGGTFESNISFMQALTEAAKLVPNAILLASLPESDPKKTGPDANVQVGGARGIQALSALEDVSNRVQALWKTVSPKEAFEIVRRRLFETIRDPKARDQVCRAFADSYVEEGIKLPQETQADKYFDRMVQSYPIHPEVFTQLYEEWTTIQGFQRTRGVLKLMAKVIHRLWQDNNKDLMILPGSLPLYDGSARNELIYHLGPGWDPVMDRDIDGERAETTVLEAKETRFGSVQAARRVARTVFLASAPASVNTQPGMRGIERGRVLLGCLQPGQTSSLYSDALNRLLDQLHYLNSSGEKKDDTTRYWFDTRANLRREMEERKKRFEDKNEVRGRMAEIVKKLAAGATFFEGTHIFTPHSDVPDDGALRLVLLAPEQFYSKEETRTGTEAVLDYVRNNGTKPRYRGNRLLFLAPDHGALARLRECIRVALAWHSIVEDVEAMRLVLDNLQAQQARKELKAAEDVLPRVARECYKWLLCPAQETPTGKPLVEAVALNTSGAALGNEIERVCRDNTWVIETWSPIHLRTELKNLYWKPGKTAVKALDFWEDTRRYLYLPRLKDRGVLAQAIVKGSATTDFFGTAYGEHEDKFDGFKFGDSNVQFDDTLLLIEPGAAKDYEAANQPATTPGPTNPEPVQPGPTPPGPTPPCPIPPGPTPPRPTPPAKVKSFHGSATVATAAAKMRLVQIAEEIIATLAADPNAEVKVRIEIEASFANGAADQTKRAVSENAKTLNFGTAEWE